MCHSFTVKHSALVSSLCVVTFDIGMSLVWGVLCTHTHTHINTHTHTCTVKHTSGPFTAELQSAEPHNQCVRSSVCMRETGERQHTVSELLEYLLRFHPQHVRIYNSWDPDVRKRCSRMMISDFMDSYLQMWPQVQWIVSWGQQQRETEGENICCCCCCDLLLCVIIKKERSFS